MNTFDQYADNYDAALARGLSISGEDKNYFARGRVAWLAQRLHQCRVRPRVVLDFGCGTGSSMFFLSQILSPDLAVGVDVSAASIAVARRRYGAPTVRFTVLGEDDAEEPADLGFCNGVFHHIPPGERAAAVSYVFSRVRPGGLFAFWENNPWNLGTRYVMSRIPFDREAVPLSPPDARRLLRDGGFEILGTDFLFLFPRILRWLRVLEPLLIRFSIGSQYMVFCRRPQRSQR